MISVSFEAFTFFNFHVKSFLFRQTTSALPKAVRRIVKNRHKAKEKRRNLQNADWILFHNDEHVKGEDGKGKNDADDNMQISLISIQAVQQEVLARGHQLLINKTIN